MPILTTSPARALRVFPVYLPAPWLCLCACLCLALCLAAPLYAAPEQAPTPARGTLRVPAAILVDLDNGAILYEQNADWPDPPASVTKVLSLFVALEKIRAGEISLNDEVTVSAHAANTGGSCMVLRAGEKLPLKDLFMGMAVASGNDASTAVAEFVGGSEENFVRMMRATAARLGMTSSVFNNPHGLPSLGQVTTARDMAALGRAYVLAFPEMQPFHTTRYMKHNGYVSYNKNPLLGKYAAATGLKTGWIRASGYNIVATASRDGIHLLAVILGAASPDLRAVELYRLFEAGFAAQQSVRRYLAAHPDAPLPLPPAQPMPATESALLTLPPALDPDVAPMLSPQEADRYMAHQGMQDEEEEEQAETERALREHPEAAPERDTPAPPAQTATEQAATGQAATEPGATGQGVTEQGTAPTAGSATPTEADTPKTVAELLPGISAAGMDFSLGSTIREAYAKLAPEFKGRIPLRRWGHRVYKGSRNFMRYRNPRALQLANQRMLRYYRQKARSERIPGFPPPGKRGTAPRKPARP